MIKVLSFLSTEIASRATPEGLAGHMCPEGHGLSTTALGVRSPICRSNFCEHPQQINSVT